MGAWGRGVEYTVINLGRRIPPVVLGVPLAAVRGEGPSVEKNPGGRRAPIFIIILKREFGVFPTRFPKKGKGPGWDGDGNPFTKCSSRCRGVCVCMGVSQGLGGMRLPLLPNVVLKGFGRGTPTILSTNPPPALLQNVSRPARGLSSQPGPLRPSCQLSPGPGGRAAGRAACAGS